MVKVGPLWLAIMAVKVFVLQMCRHIQSTLFQTYIHRLIRGQHIIQFLIGFYPQRPPFLLCACRYLYDGCHFRIGVQHRSVVLP